MNSLRIIAYKEQRFYIQVILLNVPQIFGVFQNKTT